MNYSKETLGFKREILQKIERKISEAYGNKDKDMVNFLETLIRDLDLDM